MKKILLSALIISSAFSENFGVDIALIGQLPKGEFKDEGVPTGFGLGIIALMDTTDHLYQDQNLLARLHL